MENIINGEDYYLQIDSHMIFYQGWDEILIKYFNWLQQQINNDLVITDSDHRKNDLIRSTKDSYNQSPDSNRMRYHENSNHYYNNKSKMLQ